MVMDIERDRRRFKQIVRGKIRQNLRKYITHGEMIGRKGRDAVSIPVPAARRAAFQATARTARAASGRGTAKSAIPSARPNPGEGAGGAGSDPGSATCWKWKCRSTSSPKCSAKSWSCPASSRRARPTSRARSPSTTASGRPGPSRCEHFKRTYLRALKRQISTGNYVPERTARRARSSDDKQYRSWNDVPLPEVNAVVIYLMDVSGSMTDEQKEIVRTEAFWIDAWLGTAIQGGREAVHHPRRRGQGSRRTHLLPHPRKRRHADQLGLQGVRRT